MDILALITFIIAIIPKIIELIKVIEQNWPKQGLGTEKKAMVLSVVKSDYEVRNGPMNIQETAVFTSAIDDIVDHAVSMMNQTHWDPCGPDISIPG